MNKEIQTLSPFKHFCMTIGNLPTSYIESMSYYETLLWLCKYIENTINPAINNNAEALKELQEYVANYFENLDVTEEINNKLDEMAESGQLAEIINVEMIGSLSDLNTTDKSDLVSAINEVNNNVSATNDELNINHFETYTISDITKSDGINDVNILNLTCASNETGSIAKIYGSGYGTINVQNTIQTLSFNTRLRPSETLYINNLILNIVEQDGNVKQIVGNSLIIGTSGSVAIQLVNYASGSATVRFIIPPCILFVKQFGDQ